MILPIQPPLAVFSIQKPLQVLQKLASRLWPCHLHLPIFFFYIHSPLLLDNKKLLWLLFSSANYSAQHCSIISWNVPWLCMLRDYSSARISSNIINKCRTLPVVYTILFKSVKFHSLLLYSQLNKVCSKDVWILKWVNLYRNWINLIGALNFPKRVADYRRIWAVLIENVHRVCKNIWFLYVCILCFHVCSHILFNLCDLAGFFACIENFTITYILWN